MRLARNFHVTSILGKSTRIRPLEKATPSLVSPSVGISPRNAKKGYVETLRPGLRFERVSSPHIFSSETTIAEEPEKIHVADLNSNITERVRKNLDYPDAQEMSPYEHLPLQRRSARRSKALEKIEGNFHCRNCNNRYHSNEVWVTRSTRKCVQSIECPKCYAPNRPYYLHQQDPSIFSQRGAARVKRTKKGNWVRVSPAALRRHG